MADETSTNPDAQASGTADAQPQSAAKAQPNPDIVSVPKAELEAAKAELDGYRKAKAEAERLKKEADEKALIDKGKWQELDAARLKDIEKRDGDLAESAKRFEALEAKVKSTAIARELDGAIRDVASTLAKGAAPKLAKLLKDDFEPRANGDDWSGFTRDGKSVAAHLKAYLADPDNAFLLNATSKGGAGSGGDKPGPSGSGGGEPTYLEKIAANEKARREYLSSRPRGYVPAPSGN